MSRQIIRILSFIIIFSCTGFITAQTDIQFSLDPLPFQINAVRFDPSYYYNSPFEIEKMAESLIKEWANHGVNTLFYKVYDPIYGAKFKTKYEPNEMADYGKQDLLRHILNAAVRHQIRVVAWIPAFQHKAVWDRHPEWRTKSEDGSDYRPTGESYFLCPANPDVRAWWLGFIQDLLANYKDLSGIDIAEPIVKWKGYRCYCPYCRTRGQAEFVTVNGLSETLKAFVAKIHDSDKLACLTTVASVHPDGRILSPEEQKLRTGFDLLTILNTDDRPDWLSFELMWQQWADEPTFKKVFSPAWTMDAAESIIKQVNGKSTIIGHLEMTSFGKIKVDAEKLSQSILAAKHAGIQHIDLYDTHLIDEQKAWDTVGSSFSYIPTKKIFIFFDPKGENDAKQVASLLSHFKTTIRLEKLSEKTNYKNIIEGDETVFCIIVDPKYNVPVGFLRHLTNFSGTICWINYGLDQFLKGFPEEHYGFRYIKSREDSSYNTVLYKEFSLTRLDPAFNEIEIFANNNCHRLAALSNGQDELPYAVQSDNLWYFADLPTAFVTEGGRHIAFTDLLHEIIREDHIQQRLALVRIEDLNPLSEVNSIKKIADYLKSEDVPFSISLVPFYLDPESNTAAALSDKPDLVDAIRYMVNSGGSVVMHGSTHQHRGETTADYEFWDGMSDEPLFSDSREYVRQKLLAGLDEFHKNDIFPIAWETPHYSASQLDYSVINNYFSTAYERRQTMDLHGSDQLLPYLIHQHTAGGKIIPENLGYIPLSNPDPKPILRAAKNNLAIRDGVASFFFHTFVDHAALEDIIPGLKKMGYQFISPRHTTNWVNAPDYTVLTGSGEVELTLNREFFHEFFLDEDGDVKREVFSDSALAGKISKHINVPPGWVYIAEKRVERPMNLWARFFQFIVPDKPRLSTTLFGRDEESLMDSNALPIRAAVLIDSLADGASGRDQMNFIKALHCVGIDIKLIDVGVFLGVPEDINLLVVPYAAAQALNEQQNLFVVHAVQNGMNIVLEKHSVLSQSCGIRPVDRSIKVSRVVDEYFPNVDMNWKEPDSLQAFDVDIEYVSYYSEIESQWPVVIGGEYGEGKYLYFGTYFDPNTEYGYGRFPFFIDLLKRQFNLVPTIRRNNVEIYFEPGEREDISIEDLIKIWRSNGIRRIYVSGWHFYQNYTYDYGRLIRLAHQNAMLVYIWLELPHVSEKFWLEHPEWREKTATGRDAQVDWRKHMALNIEACRQAVFDELRSMLSQFDWDGINFAELYYEPMLGFDYPQNFTPMNEEIRQIFQAQHGFDPKALFNVNSSYYWAVNVPAKEKFIQFRKNKIIELHRQFLEFFYSLKKELNTDWEIVITTIDDVFSPEIGDATAVNTREIAKLAKEFPFTLQIEDPMPLWAWGPERYTMILDAYSEIREQMPFILDINVVPLRNINITQAPTAQPTGLELYQLALAASRDVTRVALYSESSIYEVDFPILPYVMASEAREELSDESWKIEAPYTVNALIDVDAHKDIMVNGTIWPAYYRGRVILPKGSYEIRPINGLTRYTRNFKSSARLADLSGELHSAETVAKGIKVKYSSSAPNYMILTESPKRILIDGKEIAFETVRGELGYVVRLPAGTHVATIHILTTGAHVMRHASIVLSGTIVLVGFSAGTLLVTMYIIGFNRRKNGMA